MKNLRMFVSLAVVSFGFSSCCSMFGNPGQNAGTRTETRQVKSCGYDIVNEQVFVNGPSGSSKDGMTKTVQKKVPRYKVVTQTITPKCGSDIHVYCPKKDCGGVTSEATINMTSSQGSSGSPAIGLVPTMKKIAP